MMKSPKKQLEPTEFKAMELAQSKGMLDDFPIRKHISTISGTIEKTPTTDKEIANKKYVDDSIAAIGLPLSHTNAAEITDVGTNTHAQIDTHITDDVIKTAEAVDDRVASLIQNGTGIAWTYDDVANTLTGNVSITQYSDEMAQDAVGTILTDTASIDFTYDDATPKITAAVLPAGVDHSALGSLNTANYYHLTQANHTDLTDGGATTLHKHDHGALDGLADDDHTQYLLRQPTANVRINDSGADYDFTIESDGDAYMFNIDAGNNRLGIRKQTPTSTLHLGGSVGVPIRIMTESENIVESDCVIIINGTGVDGTLPLSSSCAGRIYFIMAVGMPLFPNQVLASGDDLINGSSSYAFGGSYSCAMFVPDGVSSWYAFVMTP